MIFFDTEILNKPDVIDKLPNSDSYDYPGEQKKFITQELESCNADYCLVVGHHPILSNGNMGPTPGVIENIQSVLDQQKIGIQSL